MRASNWGVLLFTLFVGGCQSVAPGHTAGPASGPSPAVQCPIVEFKITVPQNAGEPPTLDWGAGGPPPRNSARRTVRTGCPAEFKAGNETARMLIVFERVVNERTGRVVNTTPFEDAQGNPVYVFHANRSGSLRGRAGVCGPPSGCKYSVVYLGGNGAHPPLDPWIIIN